MKQSNRTYRGIEYNNHHTALIVRTTERPKYLEQTFYKTVLSSSDDCSILVLNNCRDDNIRAQNREIVTCDDWEGRRFRYEEFSRLLGVPGSINTGVQIIREHWPEVRRVIVCDDDAYPPIAGAYLDGQMISWDEALSIMLEAGWKIAGHASRMTWYDPATIREIGGIKGHCVSHVAGAFAGFSIDTWKRSGGVPGFDKLFGFGPFCNKFPGEVGYWAEPKFLITDLDRDTHPKSLRKTDYFKWYKTMRPNQAREFEDEVEDRWK